MIFDGSCDAEDWSNGYNYNGIWTFRYEIIKSEHSELKK